MSTFELLNEEASILNHVHPLLRDKMPEFFNSRIPSEFIAKCSECRLCDVAEKEDKVDLRVVGESKCCNYRPKIVNFMAGYLLEKNHSFFEERSFNSYNQKINLHPLGLFPKANNINIHSQCTFYDDGSCGIWEAVNGECSAWICYSIAGFAGRQFWLALGNFLRQLELELAQFCMEGLGFDQDDISLNEASTPQKEAELLLQWKAEYPDPKIFYRSCCSIIKRLSKTHFMKLFKTKYRSTQNRLMSKKKNTTESVVFFYAKYKYLFNFYISGL